MSNPTIEFNWVGSQIPFIDQPHIHRLNHIVVGRYGGNSSAGQTKNEDGCIVWLNEKDNWEFVILMDAHNTAESAELIVKQLTLEKFQIQHILSMPTNHQTFKKLEEKIVSIFQSNQFLSACRTIIGETACLIVARKDKYVWWFSVGDCVLYHLHEELAALGQYQVNQRQFYEWIGQVNTFEEPVPCYNVGTKELRKGDNRRFLTTDGLIECPNDPYSNPITIYHTFKNSKDNDSISSMFDTLIKNEVRDSTTVVTWNIPILKEATKPSNA